MKVKETEYEYNPIKVEKDGKEAERVIWSTKSIMVAVDAKNKGLPLKANPFCGNDNGLIKPNLVYKRTAEELEDYKKCMLDPVYFASKCFLMTPEGLQACELRDYQIDYLHHLQKNRFSIFLSCRQSGKCFSYLLTEKIIINNTTNIAHLLKKYYYYINENNEYVFDLPMFEILHIYDKSTISNIRYHLYKLIYNIEKWQEKKDKNLKKINLKVKDLRNIIKNIFQN